MLFIGICGASGSGKSTLAEELAKLVNREILIINQDAYYRDHTHLPFEERCKLNYDHPAIFEHDLLLEDVKSLLAGKPVEKKAYNYPEHRRADPTGEMLNPCDVLIVEGIHAFHDERLRELMDLKLFVRVDIDICLLRRIERDIKVRGRSIESVAQQYRDTVKPMFEQHIRLYEQHADVIVAGGGHGKMINKILASYINTNMINES